MFNFECKDTNKFSIRKKTKSKVSYANEIITSSLEYIKKKATSEMRLPFVSKCYARRVLRKADSLVRTNVSTCATLCAEIWID